MNEIQCWSLATSRLMKIRKWIETRISIACWMQVDNCGFIFRSLGKRFFEEILWLVECQWPMGEWILIKKENKTRAEQWEIYFNWYCKKRMSIASFVLLILGDIWSEESFVFAVGINWTKSIRFKFLLIICRSVCNSTITLHWYVHNDLTQVWFSIILHMSESVCFSPGQWSLIWNGIFINE